MMRILTLTLALLLCWTQVPGAQEPLCVIDDRIAATSECTRAGALDPERIESVEVLKGEAAVAMYGSRAAGGVISIRTRAEMGLAEPVADDPLARDLFAPELIMAHQQAISLSARQRSAIQEAMREMQSRFVEHQFALSAAVERLQSLLRGTTVDEPDVLRQLDRVLEAERQVKRAQIAMMVRIKNQLTEEQQRMLRARRR